MLRLCSLFLLLALPVTAAEFSGPVRVVDADTFDIGYAENIRLVGIDAPEGAQTCTDAAETRIACGTLATEAARTLYEGRQATCAWRAIDSYDRPLAVCHIDGRDVNGDLVLRGLARTYREDTTYAEEEKAAVLAGRGLWVYEMEDPAVWRALQRAPQAADVVVDDACPIKGNISRNGRIYHLPGQADYDATRINIARGERWFCSEGDARAAGWRRARR